MNEDDDDSDDSDEESEDSDGSDDSDEGDSEEEIRPKKKSKKTPRNPQSKLASKSKSKEKENHGQSAEERAADERIKKAREAENARQERIAATRALLQPVVDGFAADKERWRKEDEAVKKVAEKGKKTATRKRKANDEVGTDTPVAPRKSRRLEDNSGLLALILRNAGMLTHYFFS